MKYTVACLFLLLSCLLLGSCGRDSAGTLDDSYHAGTDFQFFQLNNSSPGVFKIQETEDGCIFIHNDFVYTYDQQSGVVVPLCSNINCLHDQEEDPEKRETCNACLDHMAGQESTSLMLYKDHVYVAYGRNDITADMPYISVLYRISLDGSSKDEIFRNSMIDSPVIHRGHMYYFTQAYKAEAENGTDSQISSVLEIHCLDLEGSKIKDETLLASEEYIGYQPIRAYGNHIYFNLVLNNSTEKSFVYDLIEEKFEEVTMRNSFTFCYDQLYTAVFDYSKEGSDEGTICISDYLNKNPREVLDHVPRGSYVVSDLKYLYVNNSYLHVKDPGTEIRFQVYDKTMTLIDEFTLPESLNLTSYVLEPPVGGEKYQYLLYDIYKLDEETGEEKVCEWGLYVWDKSSIGTLKGKPYAQTKIICFEDNEPDDPDNKEEETAEETKEPVITEEITDEYAAELSEWTEEETEFESEYSKRWTQFQMTDNEVSLIFDTKLITAEKEVELSAWYIKDDTVRVLKLTASMSLGTAPYTVVLALPEGAERFIGVYADYKVTRYKTEKDAAGHEIRNHSTVGGVYSAGRISKK